MISPFSSYCINKLATLAELIWMEDKNSSYYAIIKEYAIYGIILHVR